jgi:PQQ-like domain
VGVPAEGVIVALIELDLDAPPAAAAGRPPLRFYRYGGLLLTALLVLALGGAVTVTSVIWRRDGSLPLAGPDTSFQILGGRLYTMDTAGAQRVTTAWTMNPVRRLWSASTPLAQDPSSGAIIHDGNAHLAGAGAYTLLQSSIGTTVLDVATGAVRWASRAPVLAESDGVGVVQQTQFRAGTAYDESSGDPGPLYWSATGQPHTEPPRRTTLRGLDLATGRPLWSADVRGSAYVVPAASDATGFVVIAADALTERAAATGTVLRRHPLTRAGGSDISYPDVDGDLLLLRHDAPDGSSVATAYGLDTLQPRWQLSAPPDNGNGSTCIDLPCREDANGLTVLDPTHGAPLWHAGTYVDLIRRAAGALEVRGVSSRPLRLRDPGTGAVLADLSGWDAVVDGDAADPIVLFRAEPPDGHAAFGVLLPGGHAVQPLGRAGGRIESCVSDDQHVACRTTDGVEVWSYRT